MNLIIDNIKDDLGHLKNDVKDLIITTIDNVKEEKQKTQDKIHKVIKHIKEDLK